MTKRALWIPACLLAITIVAPAAEVAGIKMADTVTVEGKVLRLNGMGLRKKIVFKVYVAGLYLETPSKDASTAISSEQTKSIRLHILRSLSASQLAESISEGFWKNSMSQKSKLEARVQELNKMIPSVVEGDLIELTYVPGKGTMVTAKGQQRGIIQGKDFADALFAIWLGSNPIQADLKKALLGV